MRSHIRDLVYSRMQGGDGMGHAASPCCACVRAAAGAAPEPEPEPAPHARTGCRPRTGSGAFAAAGRSTAGHGPARCGDREGKKIIRQPALDRPGTRPAGPGRGRCLVVLPAGHASTAPAHGTASSAGPAGRQRPGRKKPRRLLPRWRPLQQAREHLRGTADPATSLELARPLRTPQAGNDESDAAFLLLEDAAQKGNAEAMFLVGQFYDPQSDLPRGSIPADMSQAKHW